MIPSDGRVLGSSVWKGMERVLLNLAAHFDLLKFPCLIFFFSFGSSHLRLIDRI